MTEEDDPPTSAEAVPFEPREYIRVTPSRSEVSPRTVVRQLAGLHSLDATDDGWLATLPFGGEPPPVFEFLAITEGTEAAVEFYYGADRRLDALEERLRVLYPSTVTIERVTLDLRRKLIPPVAYDEAEFEEMADAGHILEVLSQPGNAAPEQAAPTVTPDPVSTESPDRSDARQDGGSVRGAHGDGPVRARPTRDAVTPYGITWFGKADRRKDWMTTLARFTAIEADDTDHARAPLASLIDQFARAEVPLAFQVLFQRKPDWTPEANTRRQELREGRDRLIDELLGDISGRSTRRSQDPATSGHQKRYLDVGGRERAESIDKAEPQHTFTVNLRALSLVPDAVDWPAVDHRLANIATVFDHLHGAHYELRPKRARRGLLSGRNARRHADRVLDAELVTGHSWRTARPDLVCDPNELANFVTVPPSTELTTEGGRGSAADPESRAPLPLPSEDHMAAFTDDGLAFGYGVDADGSRTPSPMRLPPSLLPLHVGRFAKSGAGKSVALINDAISLYAQTSGPVIIIDAKGGTLPTDYMRAHADRFGVEDLEEHVLHFDVPDILPGFAFFDIRPALADGVDRVDAVQDTADHYEELLRLAMDTERYEEAIASRTLLQYLIKAMYDEEYGLENGHFREDVDYFTHDQLEQAVQQFAAAGPPDPDPGAAPQASDPQVAAKLERHLESTPGTFTNVVNGLSYRMDYITQNAHLRRIFNTTEAQFTFREVLDEDRVIIFDLGELRDEAAEVLTGLILTELYDAVRGRDSATLAAKPDTYVTNLLIDEAASVVVSDTLTTLLEKGREFRLSVELVTQFPEQMKEAGTREVYLNVLNNIGTSLIGKIAVDADIAEALAHEAMDPTAFKNRISSLPRGEWIAQLPSPAFGETGPEPFTIAPLPIPPGHSDGDQPLSPAEEQRFQDALETVHRRTQEEYGVPEAAGSSPSPEAAAEVDATHADDQPLEVAMARAIRAVQVARGARDQNGWVPVDAVDEELLSRVDADDMAARGYETLPEVREASPLIEVSLPDDGATVMCRLTTDGEAAAEPETSTSPTGGGDQHDAVLAVVERALAAEGFSVTVLDQPSEPRPDALATHPDCDPTVQVEVETTTHTRPVKVLTNLQKAQTNERVPLFVVADHDTMPATEIATRIANILREPRDDRGTGPPRLYTTNRNITFDGGARSPDGVTAVRPAIDESRYTRWVERDDDLVLEDATGTPQARVSNLETASKDQFPATFSHDPDAETYTVFQPGELPETYTSREAFEADWVPIKRPFVPEIDLPVPEYTASTYALAVITEDEPGESTVQYYDPEAEVTRPLAAFRETLASGDLEPVDPEAEQPPGGESSVADPAGVEAFVHERVVERDDALVPVGAVYEAYEAFAMARNYEVKAKSQLTQALREHVSFERERTWLDGQTRRCYRGIDLREPTTEEDRTDGDA